MTTFTPDKSIAILSPEDIPVGTTDIDLSYCENLASLVGLSDDITSLDLFGCNSLVSLLTLPAGLINLNLSDCLKFTSLPTTLPATLTKINLGNCDRLVNLPATLPDGLTKLDLYGCRNLVNLPELPLGIIDLDLRGCVSLPYSPALVAKLTDLEQRNAGNPHFRLIWPEHIDRNPAIAQVKGMLAEAYRSYHQSNDALRDRVPDPADEANYPTFALLHRFMNESVVDRGGLDKVVGFVLPIVEKLKANPELLEFVDESAKVHLDACVNQPVAGFTEIANLVNISSQPNIPSKLEAARVLMAIDMIKDKVRELGVGPGVEVELANAMLRDVHGDLLRRGVITSPWPGVPEGIAYQASIQSFLTPDNISRISGLVESELRSPLTKVAEYLCEHSHQDFWSRMTLSKQEIQDLNEPLMAKRKEFSALEDPDQATNERLSGEISAAEASCRASILALSRARTGASIATIGGGVVSGAVGSSLQGLNLHHSM